MSSYRWRNRTGEGDYREDEMRSTIRSFLHVLSADERDAVCEAVQLPARKEEEGEESRGDLFVRLWRWCQSLSATDKEEGKWEITLMVMIRKRVQIREMRLGAEG